MQDPNEDTEWNAVLRQKGIIPPKETEITEDDLVNMVETTIEQKSQGKGLDEMTLEELDEKEDDIDDDDERIFEEYRRQRMLEMRATELKSRYGDVVEISKADYVREVNKAGDGVWVILHVYKNAIPLCKLVNQHLTQLAAKFPQAKFLKSVSSVCIPNYPDKNLPTIFVYLEGDMKKQWVGPLAFGGMNFTQDQLEWMLAQVGAVETELEKPRKEVFDTMNSAIRGSSIYDNGDEDN